MRSRSLGLDSKPDQGLAEPAVPARILRLVKSVPERQAIASGQVDAVIDPATGKLFLLPYAQQALRNAHAAVDGDIVANSLLAALPREDYQKLLSGLELVTLTHGEVLYESGDRIRYVYFPNDCLVSLWTMVENQRVLEVGLVGREGMIGISLALGMHVSTVRVLVQENGTAMRMNAARFCAETSKSATLQSEVHRFIIAKLVAARQSAACYGSHVLEARLARCLLMIHDRIQSGAFRLTQDSLANMLGVRRVGVTHAARELQKKKIIRYQRGNLTILDRTGLEQASCACYEISKQMTIGTTKAVKKSKSDELDDLIDRSLEEIVTAIAQTEKHLTTLRQSLTALESRSGRRSR